MSLDIFTNSSYVGYNVPYLKAVKTNLQLNYQYLFDFFLYKTKFGTLIEFTDERVTRLIALEIPK